MSLRAAFLRLVAPDLIPPFLPRSLASLLLRTGFKLCSFATSPPSILVYFCIRKAPRRVPVFL
nr:MAG TPA: hypothetical protein [Caudoviricetes sp.]